MYCSPFAECLPYVFFCRMVPINSFFVLKRLYFFCELKKSILLGGVCHCKFGPFCQNSMGLGFYFQIAVVRAPTSHSFRADSFPELNCIYFVLLIPIYTVGFCFYFVFMFLCSLITLCYFLLCEFIF